MVLIFNVTKLLVQMDFKLHPCGKVGRQKLGGNPCLAGGRWVQFDEVLYLERQSEDSRPFSKESNIEPRVQELVNLSLWVGLKINAIVSASLAPAFPLGESKEAKIVIG